MFIDRARIRVSGGDGGNGVTAFRREKFVPRGGPSGGDGGRGGSVFLESTEGMNTLLLFRYNPEHRAERGRHGEGSRRHGADGADIVLKVPVGTLVIDEETGEIIGDLVAPGQRLLIAAGGIGGRGNAQFATATNRAPRRHEEGKLGQFRSLVLELKLIADVGLVGLPNAGKSTLISRISAARPKIANYPFTTLEPHLGVVNSGEYQTFVVADIPGLIEGAHTGAGLGDRFLRHIERTRILLHLVDVSPFAGDPVVDFQTVTRELFAYGEGLSTKPRLVVATKLDAAEDRSRIEELASFCKDNGFEFYAISAASGSGIRELIHAIRRYLELIRRSEQAAVLDTDPTIRPNEPPRQFVSRAISDNPVQS
ncbi:MAG: GTPase ObgE [Acidobacteria bacterium]|nr:GTPase ObgE [Acidobacteriota bacterium]